MRRSVGGRAVIYHLEVTTCFLRVMPTVYSKAIFLLKKKNR